MRAAFEYVKPAGFLIIAIAAGELPLVKAAAAWVDGHRTILLPLTAALMSAGGLALGYGVVGVGRERGRPMTHAEFEQLAARTQLPAGGKVFTTARFRGRLAGVVVPETEWTFGELKSAWRDGSWCRDPEIRRKYAVTAGGVLVVLAGFALIAIVVRPPAIKLLLAGAVVYALAQLTRALARA